MRVLVKLGLVLAGYAAAVLIASAAVAVRIALTSGPEADASSGMYAFGDALLFIAVFSAVGSIPSGLALWFLRPCRWFWIALSILGLAIATTAILAALLYITTAHLQLPCKSPLTIWGAWAVLRMLLSPPLAGAFVLAAIISSSRASRWALLAAAGGEGTVAAYAVLHWFVGCCFL